jgi:hypothetical protein
MAETNEAVDLTAGRIETRRHTGLYMVDRRTSGRHYPGKPVLIGRERDRKIERET